jgi:hypothetical protein
LPFILRTVLGPIQMHGMKTCRSSRQNVKIVKITNVQHLRRQQADLLTSSPVGAWIRLGSTDAFSRQNGTEPAGQADPSQLRILLLDSAVAQHSHPKSSLPDQTDGVIHVGERRPRIFIPSQIPREDSVQLSVVLDGVPEQREEVTQPAPTLLSERNLLRPPGRKMPLLRREPVRQQVLVEDQAQLRKPAAQGRGHRTSVIDQGPIKIENETTDVRRHSSILRSTALSDISRGLRLLVYLPQDRRIREHLS